MLSRKYFLIFFIFLIVVFSYQYFFRSSSVVFTYGMYEEKDFLRFSELLDANRFWLFHGDSDLGKKKIVESVFSGFHEDDFNKENKVPYYVYVARLNGNVVGFISFFGSDERKIGRVHLLVVSSEYRRLGLAERLMSFVVNYFSDRGYTKIFLYTRPENIRAKKLYKKMSFYEIDGGDIDFFERNPGDLLVCDLSKV